MIMARWDRLRGEVLEKEVEESQPPGTPVLPRNRQFLFENVDDGDNDAALRPGGDSPHKFLWER